MPSSERLFYLLNKYAEAAATPAEQEELRTLLNKPEYDELAKDQLLLLLQQTTPLALHSDERLKNLWKNINLPGIGFAGSDQLKSIPNAQREREAYSRPVLLRLLMNNKFWWGAAAALMLIYAAYYFNRSSTVPIAAAPVKQPAQDRAPGGNIAVLTLSDGSSITLDSARNGVLAQQGSTKISKLSNGQLAYNNTLKEKSTTILYNTLTTPRGGQYQLTLPDGSTVWLNAASTIRYPTSFSGKERTVSITGEAYFEIAKDPSMPFKVILPTSGNTPSSERREIEVLGTHFNVNAYADENTLKATLLEGSILLTSNGTGSRLEPGQQGQLNNNGRITIIKDADMEEAVAWKNGRFNFDNADIMSVMRQLARWYDVEVVFEGKIPTEKFEGEIPRNSKISEVFKILELSNVHFKVENKKVTVMP
jgi:ferric-dicitrate binding protein FerR (iron transport regulator)